MRKTFHIIYLIFGTLSFLATVQGMIKDDIRLCSVGIFCSLFSFLTAFIAEPRPRDTESDKKHDDRCQSWGTGMLLIITMAAAMLVLMSSCSTSGYGCHGRSKIMTRVR